MRLRNRQAPNMTTKSSFCAGDKVIDFFVLLPRIITTGFIMVKGKDNIEEIGVVRLPQMEKMGFAHGSV